MILEKTFNLETFTHSDTAKRLGIDNTAMTNEQLENGLNLHKFLLEIQFRLSTKSQKQILIQINSAYRSKLLNENIKGASKTSQHCDFMAADTVAIGITLEEYYQILRKLAESKVLVFGQVLFELGKHPETSTDDWIHVSLPDRGIVNDFRRSPITVKEGAQVEGRREYIRESIYQNKDK